MPRKSIFGAPAVVTVRPSYASAESVCAMPPALKTPPPGIYLVAVAFFIGAFICVAQLLNLIFFNILGFPLGPNLGTINYVLAGYIAGLLIACGGTYLLIRLHRVARWLMFVVSIVLTIQLLWQPAG